MFGASIPIANATVANTTRSTPSDSVKDEIIRFRTQLVVHTCHIFVLLNQQCIECLSYLGQVQTSETDDLLHHRLDKRSSAFLLVYSLCILPQLAVTKPS